MPNSRSVLIVLLILFSLDFGMLKAQTYKPRIGLNLNGHNGKVHEIIPFNNDKKFISISEDKTIKIWDVETMQVVKRISTQIGPGFQGIFYAGAVDPSGRYLALGGLPVAEADGSYILIVDMVANKIIGPAVGHYDAINDIVWDETGKYLFSGGVDNLLVSWIFDNGQLELASETTLEYEIHSLAYNAGGKRLIVGTYGEEVLYFDLNDLIKPGNNPRSTKLVTHRAPVNNLQVAPDQSFVLSTNTVGEIIMTDQTDKSETLREPDGSYFTALSIAPDSRYFTLFDTEGSAEVYDVRSKALINKFSIHNNIVFSSAILKHADELQVISGGGINHSVVRWSIKTGEQFTNENNVGQSVYSLTISDTSRLKINTYRNDVSRPTSRTFNVKNFSLSGFSPYTESSNNRQTEYRQDDEYTINIKGGGKIYNDINADGRILAVASRGDRFFIGSDFSLKEYDKKGNLIKEFAGHVGGIRGLTISLDGRYLISGGEDQLIIFWNLSEEGEFPSISDYFTLNAYGIKEGDPLLSLADEKNEVAWSEFAGRTAGQYRDLSDDVKETLPYVYRNVKPFLTLFAATRGEWVAWTPDGYFNCSDDGSQLFGWHINRGLDKLADFYTAEQFFDILFAPELIEASLRTGKRIEKLLSNQGIKKVRIDFSKRPSVALFNLTPMRLKQVDQVNYSNEKYDTERRVIPLEIEIYNGGSGFKELSLFQNGKLIVSEADLEDVPVGQYITRTYDVTLMNEMNTFEVYVKNSLNIDSKRDVFNILYTGPVVPTSSLHVLAVGINTYKNGRYNLNYAYDDAQSFVDQLSIVGEKIYKEISIMEVYNEAADKQGIFDAFEKIASQSQPEDVFVFYYAGHGTLDDSPNQEYYLVPTNVTQMYGDSLELATKAISSAELKEKLAGINAQKQMILMDACHSGAAVQTLSTRSAASEEKAMIQLARNTGSVMIASSGSQQFATEFEILKHGVFTYSLLDALRGRGDNGDKRITVMEIKQYMEEVVPELTEKYGGSSQYPTGYVRGRNFPIGVLEDN